jgi:hypothetical protein
MEVEVKFEEVVKRMSDKIGELNQKIIMLELVNEKYIAQINELTPPVEQNEGNLPENKTT